MSIVDERDVLFCGWLPEVEPGRKLVCPLIWKQKSTMFISSLNKRNIEGKKVYHPSKEKTPFLQKVRNEK